MRIIQYPDKLREPSHISALHFAPDGRSLVAMIRYESWLLYPCRWDLAQQAIVEDGVGIGCQEDAGLAPEPAFSPDGRFLAYVFIERGPEFSLCLVDRSARANSPRRERRLTAWAGCQMCQEYFALRFSPDGRTLIAAVITSSGEEEQHDVGETGIYRWSLARVATNRGAKWEGHLLADRGYLPIEEPELQTLHGLGKSLAFAADGSTLAVGLWRGHIHCLEYPSGVGRPTPRVGKRRNLGAWPLMFSPDGRTLAVADESVTLYEMSGVASRAVLPLGSLVRDRRFGTRPKPVVRDLAFDPSGRVIATANGDPVVRWCDVATGSALRSFDWGIGNVTAVAFSADGCLCAAAGEKGQVAVWDVID